MSRDKRVSLRQPKNKVAGVIIRDVGRFQDFNLSQWSLEVKNLAPVSLLAEGFLSDDTQFMIIPFDSAKKEFSHGYFDNFLKYALQGKFLLFVQVGSNQPQPTQEGQASGAEIHWLLDKVPAVKSQISLVTKEEFNEKSITSLIKQAKDSNFKQQQFITNLDTNSLFPLLAGFSSQTLVSSDNLRQYTNIFKNGETPPDTTQLLDICNNSKYFVLQNHIVKLTKRSSDTLTSESDEPIIIFYNTSEKITQAQYDQIAELCKKKNNSIKFVRVDSLQVQNTESADIEITDLLAEVLINSSYKANISFTTIAQEQAAADQVLENVFESNQQHPRSRRNSIAFLSKSTETTPDKKGSLARTISKTLLRKNVDSSQLEPQQVEALKRLFTAFKNASSSGKLDVTIEIELLNSPTKTEQSFAVFIKEFFVNELVSQHIDQLINPKEPDGIDPVTPKIVELPLPAPVHATTVGFAPPRNSVRLLGLAQDRVTPNHPDLPPPLPTNLPSLAELSNDPKFDEQYQLLAFIVKKYLVTKNQTVRFYQIIDSEDGPDAYDRPGSEMNSLKIFMMQDQPTIDIGHDLYGQYKDTVLSCMKSLHQHAKTSDATKQKIKHLFDNTQQTNSSDIIPATNKVLLEQWLKKLGNDFKLSNIYAEPQNVADKLELSPAEKKVFFNTLKLFAQDPHSFSLAVSISKKSQEVESAESQPEQDKGKEKSRRFSVSAFKKH